VRQIFHFEHATFDVEVALGERNLDSGFAKFLFDSKIEITPVATWPGAHLAAPDHKLEID
jgi:hypothetical protein